VKRGPQVAGGTAQTSVPSTCCSGYKQLQREMHMQHMICYAHPPVHPPGCPAPAAPGRGAAGPLGRRRGGAGGSCGARQEGRAPLKASKGRLFWQWATACACCGKLQQAVWPGWHGNARTHVQRNPPWVLVLQVR